MTGVQTCALPISPLSLSVLTSKISCYENPFIVKGSNKLTGSKENPKSICKDKSNGTLEAANMEKISSMKWLKGNLL